MRRASHRPLRNKNGRGSPFLSIPRISIHSPASIRATPIITLSRNGGRFYALRSLGVPSIHMAQHGPSEIFPESQSKFFAKDKDRAIQLHA